MTSPSDQAYGDRIGLIPVRPIREMRGFLKGIATRAPREGLADSVMLATARAYGATLWSQDAGFKGVSGVRFLAP